MAWIQIILPWYLWLFGLGLIFFPLTKKIFARFLDLGYPFTKVLAILFLSYSTFVLGTIKLVPFTRISLIFILLIFAILNIFILFRRKKLKITDYGLRTIFIIVFEEILFFIALLVWTYIRGQEPSIRSLEKFMDFGFINSILRSQFFPPVDIWYSNLPINYYYFGHLAGAALIKLTNIKPTVGYNLLLATIFAQAVTQVFSLVGGIIYTTIKKISLVKLAFFGLLGSFIVNLGGNLHTIYLFTSGYPNENPIPFWQILSDYNPTKYWYPNATRFIPFTIHEFPSYSWVVADLHGHVFDIPFVLVTIAILFILFTQNYKVSHSNKRQIFNFKFQIIFPVFLGFLTAIHYMTNAFNGPIYILLSIIVLTVIYKITVKLFVNISLLLGSFFVFSLPFSYHFKPFVTGIGVNCGSELFSYIGKIGPFLFEKGNCQISPFWMLFILWGFFWISFLLFIIVRSETTKQSQNNDRNRINNFVFLLFSFGTFLVIIPEFFYIKDIYPAHFRANTMFKLGYQAFIMMGLAASYTFFQIKLLPRNKSLVLNFIFIFFLFFIVIYPFFSIPSYYGSLNRPVELDGESWLANTYPQDKEIIDFLNKNIKDQPVILEAQGDSYTDYERISAMTGLPTVAGWWVHEWLWRGKPEAIAKRIPDVIALYESKDVDKTTAIIKKYRIKYVIVSDLERQKYPNLNQDKFLQIGRLIFLSKKGNGAIYQINQ